MRIPYPYPGITEKNERGKYVLTDEQEAWLTNVFPRYENRFVAKAMGVSMRTMHRFVDGLGLKKSEQGMKDILRRTANRIKRKCEKNGYYDKLRKIGMTKECREGFRRYMKSGQYVSPITKMQENPRRYKMYLKRRSEQRKRLIEAEKKRVSLGLPPKTKFPYIRFDCMTKRQLNHRYSAVNRGYEVGHPYGDERWMIFYTPETRRTQQFEQNLKKDGFVVVPSDFEMKAQHDYYITGNLHAE